MQIYWLHMTHQQQTELQEYKTKLCHHLIGGVDLLAFSLTRVAIILKNSLLDNLVANRKREV